MSWDRAQQVNCEGLSPSASFSRQDILALTALTLSNLGIQYLHIFRCYEAQRVARKAAEMVDGAMPANHPLVVRILRVSDHPEGVGRGREEWRVREREGGGKKGRDGKGERERDEGVGSEGQRGRERAPGCREPLPCNEEGLMYGNAFFIMLQMQRGLAERRLDPVTTTGIQLLLRNDSLHVQFGWKMCLRIMPHPHSTACIACAAHRNESHRMHRMRRTS